VEYAEEAGEEVGTGRQGQVVEDDPVVEQEHVDGGQVFKEMVYQIAGSLLGALNMGTGNEHGAYAQGAVQLEHGLIDGFNHVWSSGQAAGEGPAGEGVLFERQSGPDVVRLSVEYLGDGPGPLVFLRVFSEVIQGVLEAVEPGLATIGKDFDGCFASVEGRQSIGESSFDVCLQEFEGPGCLPVGQALESGGLNLQVAVAQGQLEILFEVFGLSVEVPEDAQGTAADL